MFALGATMVLGVGATAANAGGVLRINGSAAMPLSATSAAIGYYYYGPLTVPNPVQSYDGFVVDTRLQGFLFCNHVDSSSQPTIALMARHDDWAIGRNPASGSAAASLVAPVPIVAPAAATNTVSYNAQGLALTTDDTTQCLSADANGLQVRNNQNLFANGFDDYAVSPSGNVSSVYIIILHTPVNQDDSFNYEIVVSLAGSAAPNAMPGQMQPNSLSSTNFWLSEGYSTDFFKSCNIVAPGASVTGSGDHVIYRSCKVRNWPLSIPLGSKPLVAAALFTGPSAGETEFSDNLAFGYW